MPKHLNGLGRVFTIQEIADIFNVSVLMIRKYCREGKLNCQKIGNNPAQIEKKKQNKMKDYLQHSHTRTHRPIFLSKMKSTK